MIFDAEMNINVFVICCDCDLLTSVSPARGLEQVASPKKKAPKEERLLCRVCEHSVRL